MTEPEHWVDCRHLHADRKDFAGLSARVRALRPDAVIDTCAGTAADAAAVLPHLPDASLVVLSSMDVYRAFELLNAGQEGEPVPLTEDSAVRLGRYPYRGRLPGWMTTRSWTFEPPYLARGGTVLRLVMIYGEHDGQRREEFILRRVRAGRQDSGRSRRLAMDPLLRRRRGQRRAGRRGQRGGGRPGIQHRRKRGTLHARLGPADPGRRRS